MTKQFKHRNYNVTITYNGEKSYDEIIEELMEFQLTKIVDKLYKKFTNE